MCLLNVCVCECGRVEKPKERRKGEEEQNVHVCIPLLLGYL